MLKLLAYFDEATVLLYFAQSILVKISTNPLSAELRKIIMAKGDVYVKTEPKQKIYTWLCCYCWTNTLIWRVRRKKLSKILGNVVSI